MKTETQIADEMIEKIKREELPKMTQANISGLIISHKATCQRFLEFLGDTFIENSDALDLKDEDTRKKLSNKITDLKQAIKLYEDAGI